MDKNTLLVIVFVLVLAAAGFFGYKKYQDKVAADALAAKPVNTLQADDELTYQQMLAIFRSADAGGTWDWISGLVGRKYSGVDPLSNLVKGQRTKTGALAEVIGQAFYAYAQGGPKASEVNGGKGYALGSGYTSESLGAAIYKLWNDFKTRNEYGIS